MNVYVFSFGSMLKEPFSANELKSTLRNTEGGESPDTLARKYASLTFRY